MDSGGAEAVEAPSEGRPSAESSSSSSLPPPPPLTSMHPEPWCGKHIIDAEPAVKNVYNYAQRISQPEKTPMCRIAELSRYHKLRHEYILLDESGPAHKKRFTVNLVLQSDESYEGSGPSIKKAQQAAAEVALRHTQLSTPPERQRRIKKDSANPVQLLASVAQQLKIPVIFRDIRDPLPPQAHLPSQNCPFVVPPPFAAPFISPQFQRPPPPPLMALPPGVPPFYGPPIYYSQQRPNTPIDLQATVVLKFGANEVRATGANRNQARVNAALEALKILAPDLEKLNEAENVEEEQQPAASNNSSSSSDSSFDEEKENSEDTPRKSRQKSVISLIHERALQMRMDVEFEILKESGEPHKRQYLMRCMLRNQIDVIVADGEGGSKRNAKQVACAKMLEKLNDLKSDPVYIASALLRNSRRQPGALRDQKRKTIVKDMKKNPLYGHHINPVSRLIQVMQISNEPDPKFRIVGENGQGRYKEFVVEATCKDIHCQGTGPNKKLAKRAAAEAMLAKIGYDKPMPQRSDPLMISLRSTRFHVRNLYQNRSASASSTQQRSGTTNRNPNRSR
ncbi:hypothetical protein L596_014059 [Steinernema carpocapsae]|uniref:DRBM domain-containing protein n=1 Tax=Steinernema carpocapsae TaxID=34508 RepID=A0A4U5NAQ2_STECR|nr:hypothetical protein L596_014059 [Steinernema carpocapsae]